MGDYSAWHALTGEHGPAPKEERMRACPKCRCYIDPKLGEKLLKKGDEYYHSECYHNLFTRPAQRKDELRAVYDKAYFAALGGMSGDITPIEKDSAKYGYTPDDIIVRRSHDRAMRVVSQWPAMQAELDALIGEIG